MTKKQEIKKVDLNEIMIRYFSNEVFDSFRQKCWRLHRSVSALMDDAPVYYEETANMLLTVHIAFIGLFVLFLIDKHFISFLQHFEEIWPVRSKNFRNPLASTSILAFLVGGPAWLFWRSIGRFGIDRPYKNLAASGYYLRSYISCFGVNFLSILVTNKLGLPEASLVISVINLLVWGRWSMKEYDKLLSEHGFGSR